MTGENATSLVTVPVQLDALCVPKTKWTHDLWFRARLSFGDDHRDPEPNPMNYSRYEDESGVGAYLHWHLPEALGRGRLDLRTGPDADTVFPPVPNRWLVIRYYHPHDRAASVAPDVAGWVVQSDYETGKTTPTPRGTSPVGKNRWLGRKLDLSTSDYAEPAKVCDRLTVQIAGVPTFASFQPYCQDVFSLHDDLGGETGRLAKGHLSYTVIGWYAKASDDPLTAEAATELLTFYSDLPEDVTYGGEEEHAAALSERLGWKLPAKLATNSRSLYHGAVYGLAWDPADTTVPSGDRPRTPDESVKVAIGHGSGDAVAAMVRENPPDTKVTDWPLTAELTRSYHSGHLADGDHATTAAGVRTLLNLADHSEWFARSDGGSLWQLVDGRPVGGPPLTLGQSRTLRQALAKLNDAQHLLDHGVGERSGALRTVWDLWWLLLWYDSTEDPPDDFEKDKLQAALKKTEPKGSAWKRLEAAAANVRQRTTGRDDALRKLATLLPTGWSVKQVPREAMHQPLDPTVVLRGIGIPLRESDTAQPPPRRETLLPTRVQETLLTGADVQKEGSRTEYDVQVRASDAKLPVKFSTLETHLNEKHSSLVAPLRALVGEAYVLHTVAHYYRKQPTPLADRKPLKGLPRLSVTPQNSAVWPIDAVAWHQPWRPLTVAWRLSCFPLPYELPSDVTKLCWTFDGRTRQLRADEAVKSAVQDCGKTGYTVVGRSLVSQLPVFNLQQRTDEYTKTFGGSSAFTTLRSGVANWDLWSISLTGLRDALGGRKPGQVRVASPPYDNPVTPPEHVWPDADAKRPLRKPVQSAQLGIRDLYAVDSFGTAVMVIRSIGNDTNHTTYKARKAPSAAIPDGYTVTTTNPVWTADPLWQLPPRLPQPARVCLTPLSHRSTDGGDDPIDPMADPREPENSPACGWLVVRGYGGDDKLKNCRLAVYDPAGVPLGEVLRIGPSDKHAVSWRPLPSSTVLTPGDVFSSTFLTQYPYLAGFLREIVDSNADEIAAGNAVASGKPKRFADFCATVDNGLLSTRGRPATQGIGAALAAGRPIALVRLRVHMELNGPLRTDPHWTGVLKSEQEIDAQYNRRWPVRLGTGVDRGDGLVGYFAGSGRTTSYTTLYSEHGPSRPVGDYVKAIDGGAGVTVPARPRAQTVAATDAAYVTVLMDPFLTLHAHTDLLPVTRLRPLVAAAARVLDQAPLSVPVGPGLARAITSGSDITPLGGPPDRLTFPAPSAAGDWSFAARVWDPQALNPWHHFALTTDATAPQLEPDAPDAHTGYLVHQPEQTL
ncbi:hypothetical protein [Streptomyces chrestomyceticus]|uniref:hypothetical protein n=1 Tax=Streptomyces chrestomyceticus TaxID=68185 RepID=UPI0033C99B01